MMCKEFQKLNISSAFMNLFNFHHLKIKGAPLNVIWTSTFTRNSKSKSTYIVWSSPNRNRTHSDIFIIKKNRKWTVEGGHVDNFVQLMSLCICSSRRFENYNREISHTCNFVSLHLFKQAIWEHMWILTFEKITHMQQMWICIWSSRRFEETCEN